MYTFLVVEDDAEEASRLEALIRRYIQDRSIEANIVRYASALSLMNNEHAAFDLIFMDIQMPGMSGMEAATLMRTYDAVTPLIFVTSHAQYAINGYDVGALGFLVKPVTYGMLTLTMNRAMEQLQEHGRQKITISSGTGLRMVSPTQIAYVEVFRHRLTFHLVSGDALESRGTLTDYEQRLAGSGFVRISSSFLVNMNHVHSARGNEVLMDSGAALPLSRARRKAVILELARYLGRRI